MHNTLVQRAQNGDGEAFISLIENNRQNMYRIALGMLKNDTDAADAIQDTALTCYEKIGTLRDPDLFKHWMTKILVNHCRSILRERHKMVFIQELPEYDSQPAPEKEITDNMDFVRLMNRIDAKYRIVLLLFYAEEFSIKEISEIMEINENTVKTRLSRGRNMYKEIYLKELSFSEARCEEV